MRLLFVADGRSPIALNWIVYFIEQGHEVHLASTFPCTEIANLASLSFVPVAFSGTRMARQVRKRIPGRQGMWGASALQARTAIRHWLGPLTITKAARGLEQIIANAEPELIHAMRIPYEGMLAAQVKTTLPLLISVWGNDFTLHAPSTPLMAHFTRLTLQRADALHTDCYRDQRLARMWGFPADKRSVVLPGAGGVQPELFYPPHPIEEDLGAKQVQPNEWLNKFSAAGILPQGIQLDRSGRAGFQSDDSRHPTERDLTIINPRGFRAYVRNDTFFRAIPRVLDRQPRARFLCPAMEAEPSAWRWVERLGITSNVELLPIQSRPQMADLFRGSRIAVSPATHDGTPNTLLEAMACGCLPIAGGIESIREWIVPGLNGLLFDPADPQALTQAILLALEDETLHRRAGEHNARLIAEKARYPNVMAQAQSFYENLIGKNSVAGE